MPIPKPKKDEKQKDFHSRCMSVISDEYENKQANAICYSQWRKEETKMKKNIFEIKENIRVSKDIILEKGDRIRLKEEYMDIDTLEDMIDSNSLMKVVESLIEICRSKAKRALIFDKDKELSQGWQDNATLLERILSRLISW